VYPARGTVPRVRRTRDRAPPLSLTASAERTLLLLALRTPSIYHVEHVANHTHGGQLKAPRRAGAAEGKLSPHVSLCTQVAH
jgi:hypothetical protein